MKDSEFKYTISYERADKEYGNGDGIHFTVRGDDFDEALAEMKEKRTAVTELLQKERTRAAQLAKARAEASEKARRESIDRELNLK